MSQKTRATAASAILHLQLSLTECLEGSLSQNQLQQLCLELVKRVIQISKYPQGSFLEGSFPEGNFLQESAKSALCETAFIWC